MQKPKKTIKVVAAIIFEENSIYCFRKGQNKYEYLSNKFEFPGGKIEPNENKKQALKREILDFLNHVRENNEPLTNKNIALNVLKILNEIKNSKYSEN